MHGSRSRRELLRLVAGLALAVTLVGLLMPAGDARAQDAVSISIHDFTFDPGTITITAGTTVTWTNNDTAPHTATADDGSFDSGNLATGQSFSMTFDTPGTYTYHCTIHPNMTATIVVTEASTSGDNGGATTEDQGQSDGGSASTLPETGAGNAAADHSSTAFLVLTITALGLTVVGFGLRRQGTEERIRIQR